MVEKIGQEKILGKKVPQRAFSRESQTGRSKLPTRELQSGQQSSQIKLKYLQSQIVQEEEEENTIQKPDYIENLASKFKPTNGVRLTFYGQQSNAIVKTEQNGSNTVNMTKKEFDERKKKTFVPTSFIKRPATVQDLPVPEQAKTRSRLRAATDQVSTPLAVNTAVYKVPMCQPPSKVKVNDLNLLREMLNGNGWSHGPESDNERYARLELNKDDFELQGVGRPQKHSKMYHKPKSEVQSAPQSDLPGYHQSLHRSPATHQQQLEPSTSNQTSASFYRRLRQSASSTSSNRYRVRHTKFERRFH